MNSTTHNHAHGADLDAFVDLINTVSYDDGQPHERLPTAPDAIDFFAMRGLAHQEALATALDDERTAERRLAKLRNVRAAAREVWDALVDHRDADASAIERVNEALRHRPLVELTPGRDGCGVGHRHVGDPWDEALARVLEPFVESVAQGQTERYRVCANDGCRWIFYDGSRAGRRRWCDMSSCGNRAKAARHRARKRASTAETETA